MPIRRTGSASGTATTPATATGRARTADLVAPDRIYAIYRQVVADPVSIVGMETVCANPWTYPHLLNDPNFVREVRKDGRFVAFLEHHGLIPRADRRS